ncbi:MAG: cobalamin B12-binding domain-containing protein [Proteobacteria bacterium]|nr:cobalamin B12-binding domain-containing protein [Pseudomonadota bacterium]MBU1418062.1 cobalamin B12-binding domain-containing protein [Pseudomonadota bacterium]MBU1454098.1 cobalamin B12-binding domain-containing protein [Pseudomonadota bacterium]
MAGDKSFYKIGTLARESGVTPTLLRAWEKRYALWIPERGPGGQRLYSQEDMFLICHIAESIAGGHRIGELAALGREQLLKQVRTKKEAGEEGVASETEKGERGNGLESYIKPLVSAAETVDLKQLGTELQHAMLELSPDRLVYEVLLPVMARVGELYLSGRIGVAGEHLVSSMVEQYLRNCLDQARTATMEKRISPVLCCCFPGEEHRLGVLAVSYALARQGYNVVYLGAALPLDALQHTIIKLRPTSVWLSVTSQSIYRNNRSQLAALIRRNSNLFVVGGQGVRTDDPLLLGVGCKLMSPLLQLPADIYQLLNLEDK